MRENFKIIVKLKTDSTCNLDKEENVFFLDDAL